MDSELTEILKQRSVEHRQHTTSIFDCDGKPAISGSLLLRGDDYDTAVKELLKKLNKEDPLRKFVISSSQKTTGSATFACSVLDVIPPILAQCKRDVCSRPR